MAQFYSPTSLPCHPSAVQSTFSHWSLVEGAYDDPSTAAGRIVAETRARKGLNPVLPTVADLSDRL